MPILSSIALTGHPPQPVLSVRRTIDFFTEFSATAERAFGAIGAYAEGRGLLFFAGPFVCYHNTDLAHLDVELGFPLAQPVAGEGEIEGHTIPAQRVVSGLYLGPYEETDPLMLQILAWIEVNGYEQLGPIYNHYLNDTQRPPNEYLTRVAVPVK